MNTNDVIIPTYTDLADDVEDLEETLNGLTVSNITQAQINEACEERMELLMQQMAKQEGVTEVLKATDQMEWVRRMNSIRNRAEEIVLHELVYVS